MGHAVAASGIQIYNYTEKKNINYTGKQIIVTYRGKKISDDLAPGLSFNGVVLVSGYDTFVKSKIGAAYSYNKENGSITIKKNGNYITMKLGSQEAKVNGNKVKIPAAPILIKYMKANTTKVMLPVKFVIQVLNYGYTYLEEKNEVVIKSYRYGAVPGNIAYGSKYIYQNGWIYTTIFDTFLTKIKPDGAGRQWVDIYNPENLNYKDGYLYYLSSKALYRNTSNGLHKVTINDSQHILKFIIYDNYIYYVNMDDSNNIYRMNLDGSGRKRITSEKGCFNLYITDSYIFYSSDKGFYRINRNGIGKLKLSSYKVKDIVSDSKYLYYINNSNLQIFKSNYDGTNLTRLCYDNAVSLTISGNVLYYQNQYDQNKLYAITTKGKAKTIIVNEAINNPTIVDDDLYYTSDKSEGYVLHKVKLKELEEELVNPDSVGNTTGNIVNDAFTAFNDISFYLCDPWLYRAPKAFQYMSELRQYTYKDRNDFYGINLVGDYIYCTGAKHVSDSNYSSGIYKIKADGTQPPIQLTNMNADYLTVIGNWMYFTVGSFDNISYGSGSICKMKTDGSEFTVISGSKYGSARCLSVIGDSIYFVNIKDNYSIYRMNLDGGDVKRLSADGMVYTFHVYGDDIYYHNLNNRSIMKMPKAGGEGTVILSMVYPKMYVYQDRIYYFGFNGSDGHDGRTSLYSSNLDGTEVTFLRSEVLPEYINITNGYVYFKNNYGNQTVDRIKSLR
jgi:hypothetical protein